MESCALMARKPLGPITPAPCCWHRKAYLVRRILRGGVEVRELARPICLITVRKTSGAATRLAVRETRTENVLPGIHSQQGTHECPAIVRSETEIRVDLRAGCKLLQRSAVDFNNDCLTYSCVDAITNLGITFSFHPDHTRI